MDRMIHNCKSETKLSSYRHNYSFLPAAGTTVPVSVMPMRPETTGSSVHTQGLKHGASIPPVKQAKHRRRMSWCCMNFSWKCLSYCLAALLIFCMAVIVYLLVDMFMSSGGAGIYFKRGPPMHGVHSTPCLSGADGEKETVIPLRPLPESFSLGDPIVADLPPGRLAYTYFTLQRDAWVRFNLSVETQAKLAIYGRQTLLPTPTQHDFLKIILGEKLHAQPQKRSAIQNYGYLEKNLRNTLFVQFLVAGRWNLGFLNDDSQHLQTLKFTAALKTDAGLEDCKYGCYGKGVCKDGKCYCFEGYTGLYCEETICPVLCSGNGVYSGGSCYCHQGWKGLDCDIPDNVCEIPNCNDHGRCNSRGECDCHHRWTGDFCEERACPQKNCSNHGVCVGGICYCEFGWRGAACEEAYTAQGLCPSSEKCSGQGTWDVLKGSCRCEIGWTGESCEIKLCNMFCGPRGRCEGSRCVCDEGWAGEKCEQLACNPGCEEHGSCQNGTCKCEQGWNGENCQLNGCPNGCNSHGECRMFGNNWRCACSSDYSGAGCTVPMELECSDEKDNDGDGLVDCADSECCSSASCQSNTFCLTVPDPQTILLREQAPPPQASFFQKIRFLIESDSSTSVQQYSTLSRFNETRASVIRGRVVHSRGGPLIGVRISDISDPLYGFTISRSGGKFDLVVNGGGSVTLKFMRQHLGSIYRTVRIPWNQIIVIDDVVMSLTDEEEKKANGALRRLSSACNMQLREHWIRPYLLPSWRFSKYGGPEGIEGNGRLLADSRTVHESVRLPGTSDLYLSYSSAQAAGYQSALSLFLVPEVQPQKLRLVKLKIIVAGVRFETTLEAKPNLTYWYRWDKRNVYKQKIFGLTIASVAVGYVYSECEEIFWENSEVKLNGYKSAVSDLGGWNLNIHHYFDVLDGVVDKGDGSTVYLKEEPPVLATLLGTGQQRALDCTFCNGAPTGSNLFQPLALASAKNDTLFIGDYNLIRRLTPNKTLVTVLQLSPSDTAHRYYMAVHPVTDELYISLPLRRQIWKLNIPKNGASQDVAWNYEVVVGNGKSCVFGESCGDGGPSKMASLTFPKGLVFDSHGSLYFADERRIRVLTVDGLVHTIIGGEGPGSKKWRPLPCIVDFEADKVNLEWPTDLAVDPLSDNLIILDSDMVFRLRSLQSVRLEIGAPPHCSQLTDSLNRTRSSVFLKDATGISVDLEGRILIAESDGKRINRVRSFDLHGRSDLVAGAESNCDCHPQNCPCDDSGFTLAKDARLHSPFAVEVDAAGLIHIADQGNFKIKTVQPVKPRWNPSQHVFEIYSGSSQEIYLFNRLGKHVATKSLLTEEYVYNFTYDVDTSFGRLVHVTGSGGHRLYFRKVASEVQIETSQSRKAVVKLGQFNRMLETFTGPDGAETKFDYDANTGLLVSRRNADGTMRFYRYDDYGYALSAVSSTGVVRELEESVYEQQRVSVVKINGEKLAEYRTADWEIEQKGLVERSIYMLSDGSTFYLNANGARSQFDSLTHSLLAPHEKTLLKQKLQTFSPGNPSRPELTSRLEWRYYLKRDKKREKKSGPKSVIKVGRKTRVNGLNILTADFDRKLNMDRILLDGSNVPVMNIFYNNAGSPIRFEPSSKSLASMNISMDSLGRISGFSRGDKVASFEYNRFGRLTLQKFNSETTDSILTRKYGYSSGHLSWPSTVQLPSGSEYHLSYDKNGGLKEVVTASGEQHWFQFLNEMGFGLSLRYFPYVSQPFLVARNDRKQPVSVVFPTAERRVTFIYRMDGSLKSVWHDRSTLSFGYKMGEKMPTEIDYENPVLGFQKRLTYQGPFLTQSYEKRSRDGDTTASCHFAYTYDNLLRVTVIQASFGDQIALEPLQYAYESGTGRLERMGNFVVKYVLSKIRIQGDNVYMDKIIGPFGYVTHSSLGVRGRKVCQLYVARDDLGRISGVTGAVGNDRMAEVKMSYNVDGRLNQMSVGKEKKHHWTIHYDLDGRVMAVNKVKVSMEMGLVKKFGDLLYETDLDGFVMRRGPEKYKYDSFGRLIHTEKGSFNLRYEYDEMHRLIFRELEESSRLYFFYALLHRPHLITHVYDSLSGMVTVYHYDVHDNLFSIEQAGNRFYVQTFPDGSPVHVFSEDGELKKSTLRGPFGQVVKDSDPDFLVFVGFRRFFQDPETGLVIQEGRPLDPLIGKWMSISVVALLASLHPYFPEKVDLLAFNWGEELTSDLDTNEKDWLELSGIFLERVVPLLGNSVAASTLSHASLCPDGQFVSLGIECGLKKRIQHFQHFLTSDTSKVLPRTPFPSPKTLTWSITPSVYGEGVLVTNYSGVAVTEFALSANQRLQEAMLVLLNESKIIPVVDLGVLDEREQSVVRHYFWKPQSRSAREDLSELGIERKTATLTQHLNATLTDVSGAGSAKLITVYSERAALAIYYGDSLQAATEYFADAQLTRTAKALWAREKAAAAGGRGTRHQWTEKEREELAKSGKVEGYIVRRRMETDCLLLAGDPNFLQFERTLKKRSTVS